MANIKLFENRQVRSVWSEKDEKWYFSVQDVIEILTGTVDAKDYIKKMRKRDQALNANWGTICPPVEMEAADGFVENKKAANQGGKIAGDARKALELETGANVVTANNYLPESKQTKQIGK